MKTFKIIVNVEGNIKVLKKEFLNQKEADEFCIKNGLIDYQIQEEKDIIGDHVGKIKELLFKDKYTEEEINIFLKSLINEIRVSTLKIALKNIVISYDESNKKMLNLIYDMQNQKGIVHEYDLFSRYPDIFSSELLSLLRQNYINKSKVLPIQIIEGFLDKEESIRESQKEVKKEIWPKVKDILFLIVGFFLLLGFGIPYMLENVESFSDEEVSLVDKVNIFGKSMIYISEFVSSIWLYVLIFLFGGWILGVFMYSTNIVIRKKIQDFLLKIPGLGSILKMIITQSIFKTLETYTKVNSTYKVKYNAAIASTGWISFQEELKIIRDLYPVRSGKYSEIFSEIPKENRNFIRGVYVLLPQYADSRSGKGGDELSAIKEVVLLCKKLWNTDLSKIPLRIGRRIENIQYGLLLLGLIGFMSIISVLVGV